MEFLIRGEKIKVTDSIKNYIEEDLKEENEDDAYDAYQEATDGCDPDGFYGWDDYWHWKNG